MIYYVIILIDLLLFVFHAYWLIRKVAGRTGESIERNIMGVVVALVVAAAYFGCLMQG